MNFIYHLLICMMGWGLNKYNYSLYTFDGLHPNAKGKELFGNKIASQMQSMI